jgi:choline kinase
MKKTVIIAAAGSGSRLGFGLPKCLVKIGGHAIFEYQLKAFEWADDIRIVVGYQAETVVRKISAVAPNVKFIHNKMFSTTNLRQSYFLGAQGVTEKAIFLDGDTIIGRTASNTLFTACELQEDFIAVTRSKTADPIYTGILKGNVQWFSYTTPSEYELANAAFLAPEKLEYENTLFYKQLEKYLPTKAVLVDTLEIDTPKDLAYAEHQVAACPSEYDFWR